jgi:hypothetical protein
MERIDSDFAARPRRPATYLAATAIIAVLFGAVPIAAQTPEPDEHPYGLDPYKPSDAALLRDYGVTLVAQTPLLELRKLDPYKPSHAALLRDIGGAIPLWGVLWYPGPVPASFTPFPMDTVTGRPAARKRIAAQPAMGAAEVTPPAPATPPSATSITTLQRPENNDGVWITFAQQKWISAGQTIPFEPSKFVRVGEYGAFPVFRRVGESEETIYVPIRDDLVAPYRLKP